VTEKLQWQFMNRRWKMAVAFSVAGSSMTWMSFEGLNVVAELMTSYFFMVF
jgi:hypothetical protein